MKQSQTRPRRFFGHIPAAAFLPSALCAAALLFVFAHAARAGVAFSVLHTFDRTYPSLQQTSIQFATFRSYPLTQDPDGSMLGVTSGGGEYGNGCIYAITPAGILTVVHSFSPTTLSSNINDDGAAPNSTLIESHRAGELYGATASGGADGDGVIYETNGKQFAVVADLPTGIQAAEIQLMFSSAGKLYGVIEGTPNPAVFTVGRGGSISFISPMSTQLFTDAVSDVAMPDNSILVDIGGGLFRISPSSQIRPINGPGSDSQLIVGTNIVAGPNSTAFVAQSTSKLATVYRISESGAAGAFAQIVKPSDPQDVPIPVSLAMSSTGLLYCACIGQPNNNGDLFAVTPAGSASLLSTSLPPNPTVTPGPNGGVAGYGELDGTPTQIRIFTADSSGVQRRATIGGSYEPVLTTMTSVASGAVYGTLSNSGPAGIGTVFRVDDTGKYATLDQFTPTDAAGTGPATFVGSFVHASDGNVYAVSSSGGAFNDGAVIRYAPNGLYDIVASLPGATLAPDTLDRTMVQGADGDLYLVADAGPGTSLANVFKVTLAGSLTEVGSLDYESQTSLAVYLVNLEAAANGVIYGTSYSGGTSGTGFVFEISAKGKLTVVADFPSTSTDPSEANPVLLTVGANGSIYGACNGGSIFELSPSGAPHFLADLSADGPTSLAILANGAIYGTARSGGVDDSGQVFEISPSGQVTTLASLESLSKRGQATNPRSLLAMPDGSVFGIADGGPHNAGIVFEVPSGKPIRTLYAFSESDSDQPSAAYPQSLVLASDGNIYGTTGSLYADTGYYGGSVFVVHRSDGSVDFVYDFSVPSPTNPAINSDGNGVIPAVQQIGDALTGTAQSAGAEGAGDVFSMTITPDVATAASATAIAPGVVRLSCAGVDRISPKLTYTWATVGKPAGAISPIFQVNGTAGASTTNAAVSKPGSYTFDCTIANGLGGDTQTTCAVDVN